MQLPGFETQVFTVAADDDREQWTKSQQGKFRLGIGEKW